MLQQAKKKLVQPKRNFDSLDHKLNPESGLTFAKLVMREFPDREALEAAIGQKRTFS